MNNIVVSGSVMPSTTNTPVNARSRIDTLAEVELIDNPAIGETFYCIENKTLYLITGLKSKTVAGIVLLNAVIDTYSIVCQDGDNAFSVDSELQDTSTNPVENRAIAKQFLTVAESIDTIISNVSNKQDKLISSINIKTVNGESLLGEGNIEIKSAAEIDLDDTVTESGSNAVTSAGIFSAITNKVDGKFKVLTEADYNSMTSHDGETFYFILK